MTDSEREHRDKCPKSERADGPWHAWKWDGDDPYVLCVYCGERRDALTGKSIVAQGRQI